MGDHRMNDACPSLEDLLLAQEHELPSDQARILAAHLAHCRKCQEELIQLDAYARATAAVVAEELDALSAEDEYQRFLDRQSSHVRQHRPWVRRLSPARWWLAAVLVLGLSTLLWPEIIVHAQAVVGRVVEIVRHWWADDRPAMSPQTAAPVVPATPASGSPTDAAPDAEALERAELDARWILAAADVDWRNEIRVRRSRDGVHVEGTLRSTSERLAVSAQLRALPHVKATFRVRVFDAAAPLPTPGLSRWLDRTYGATRERRTFMDGFMRHLDRIDGRLRALQALATRYPASVVSKHPPPLQETFQRLVEWHVMALIGDLRGANRRMAMLIGPSSRPCSLMLETPRDWRTRVASGARHVASFNAHLRDLLTQEDVQAPEEGTADIERAIDADFGALWTALNCPDAVTVPDD